MRITITLLPHTNGGEDHVIEVDEDTPVLEVSIDGAAIYSLDMLTLSDADDGGDQEHLAVYAYDAAGDDWERVAEVPV